MTSVPDLEVSSSVKERKRSKSVDSRGSSISSEVDSEAQKGARRRSKESTISEERTVSQRLSKAIEEEDAFLDYIQNLPAMSSEKVEAYKKAQSPVYKRSTSEVTGGIEHLDNLYRLMEHLGQLRIQNTKLQERVKYLENIAQEDVEATHKESKETEIDVSKIHSRSKRSTKCKSSHYGIRQSLGVKTTRERSRSVGVEEILKSTTQYRLTGTQEFQTRGSIKAKVSKWTKVKEAFRWEKASNGVLPEAKSQDSGLGVADEIRYLQVPQTLSDNSSVSVSPADSVLSGQSLSQPSGKDCLGMPHISSSASNSDEELEDNHFGMVTGLPSCTFRSECEDQRRSKSLDGDTQLSLITCDLSLLDSQDNLKEQKIAPGSQKGNKTPWSKMKDIIQTRTGSVKKKKGDSDVEDESRSGIQDDRHSEESHHESMAAADMPVDYAESDMVDKSLKRRLAPTLTITLPSMEELHSGASPSVTTTSKVAAKPPPSPQNDERHVKISLKPKSHEDPVNLRDPELHRHAARKISGGSTGTSPPTPRRLSKWSKVKNAFLTSGSASEDCLHRGSSSVPSSPVKSASFAYDIESDELSSGEFMDDNIRDDDVFPEPVEELCDLAKNTNIQVEIQRNYEELQLKLSQEFHKKLCEWERIKSGSGSGTPPCGSKVGGSGFSSGTSSVGDDSPHDKVFRKKMEEWEKIKSPGTSGAKHKDASMQMGEDNLSADFKKKLEEWDKLKSGPVPQTPDIANISQPHFKKKITDWQLWRPGVMTSKSDAGIAGMASPPAELPEDFYRKLQEWERLKHASTSSAHPDTESPGTKTPSPGSARRECNDHKTGKSQHSPTHKKEKGNTDFGFQLRIQKSKSHHEVKELAWLEKELHKIEREKQRLERERDKYLERETRLEKLRKAIGANVKKQEVLIPTSTGLFRFQGISQKFTRKLYEWEKAKGIGPEASTFALLDPGYLPPGSSSETHTPDGLVSNGSLLTRSKSMGSVVDIVALAGNQSTLTHQPSSLSLNHMEQLESNHISCSLRDSDELCVGGGRFEEEPQAMIVDVEDVVEETASPLEHTPVVESQTPVYCYAPSEVTRLIDSSGSGSEKDVVGLRMGIEAQSSIELLQENITLLDKLQQKEDICRELEYKMGDVEDKLNTSERIHREHLGTLVQDEDLFSSKPLVKEQCLDEIKEKLLELESQQERLREEGVNLQHSFVEHSEQQALIAQHLVGKVKQLQNNITTTSADDQNHPDQLAEAEKQPDALSRVQDLTSQLLSLAEKLEVAVGERNQEISYLRRALGTNGHAPGLQRLRSQQHWFSTDSVSSVGVTDSIFSQGTEDLTKLPVLLTNKLQELKTCLGSLTAVPNMKTQPVLLPNKDLNIIMPDSPEIETTFIFNIAKKNIKESMALETKLTQEEEQQDVKFPSTSKCDTSFTFVPTTVLTFSQNERTSPDSLMNQTQTGDEKVEEVEVRQTPTNLESVIEFTYPIKTVFKEGSREKRFAKHSGHHISDSDDSDFGNKSPKSTKSHEMTEVSGSENGKEIASSKKYRRTRHNSGHLERRRNQIEAKEENSDDEQNSVGLFEACTSKKGLSYETRFKKVSKSKASIKDYCSEDKKGCKIDNIEICDNTVRSEQSKEPIRGSLKPVSSPKCIPRRNKKGSKSSKDEKCASGNGCISYNYCCNPQNDDAVPSQEMTVNVFVPTTRKIFSPVRKDSKGEMSTVISYIVEEPESNSTPDNVVADGNINYGKETTNNNHVECSNNNGETTNSANALSNEKLEDGEVFRKKTNENKEETKQTFDFVLPPCWIIKQARAQSASPALQRRTIQKSWTKELNEKTAKLKLEENKENSLVQSETTAVVKTACMDNFNKSSEGEATTSVHKNTSTTDLDCTKGNILKEACKKLSSSSESVDNTGNRPLRKESSTIPSSLKLRSEAGFPPISPLTVRREMKVLKETAPSIRMMIAKYNQKVYESQELTGTKSPDSGGQSPVAWRSPVSERRIKAQMEKYEEEERRALQSNSKKEFYPHGKLGQVQKSASAGFIRPFEKGSSNDSINEKSGEKSSSQNINQYHRILKSSSAGAIKSFSPLPTRRQNINNSDSSLKLEASPLSAALLVQYEVEPQVRKVKTDECQTSNTRKPSSDLNNQTSITTQTAKNTESPSILNVPPIPTTLNNTDTTILELDHSPDTTRIRALKIKKAKEEFLLRGCVQEVHNNKETVPPELSSTPTTPLQNERLSWADSRSRLSQLSCGSESSYENAPMIVVGRRSHAGEQDRTLLVKSASAGMINIDSEACSKVFSGSSNLPASSSEQAVITKSKSGILSRFRKARMKRNKDKDQPKLDTVSTLCRQSLVVDISKRNQSAGEPLPSTSKSCPSSPVLNKKDQARSGSWTSRIFKPK